MLVEHEFDACERALRDMKPKTEMAPQIAQKIIDINFRLNPHHVAWGQHVAPTRPSARL